MSLVTPFGEIVILTDDVPVTCSVSKKEKKHNYKDVLGCYRITVDFIPDGRRHEIKCIIPHMKYKERGPESGQDIECQSFYNDNGGKISICLNGEVNYLADGSRWSDKYDYDIRYLENGMAYIISENTKESRFVFGIAWIDNVYDEYGEFDHGKDVQTWLAADFTLD